MMEGVGQALYSHPSPVDWHEPTVRACTHIDTEYTYTVSGVWHTFSPPGFKECHTYVHAYITTVCP